MTWDEFLAWAKANDGVTCRVKRPGRWHAGYLSTNASKSPHVRDSTRAPRSQYQMVSPSGLAAGHFQIKDGSRYRELTRDDLSAS